MLSGSCFPCFHARDLAIVGPLPAGLFLISSGSMIGPSGKSAIEVKVLLTCEGRFILLERSVDCQRRVKGGGKTYHWVSKSRENVRLSVQQKCHIHGMGNETLNPKEQTRLQVLNSLLAEHMTLDQAATLMGVTTRHTRRILAAPSSR